MVDRSRLPALEDIDAAQAYLAWTLTVETDRGRGAVEEVFEFVEGDGILVIEEVPGLAGAPAPDAAGLDVAAPDVPVSDVAVLDVAVPAASGPVEVAEGPGAPSPGAAARTSVRVDLERIDRLVNMVGEIVIAQAVVLQQVDDHLSRSHPQLVDGLAQFFRHTQNLQDAVMAIRAQPVQTIFSRLPRLVREVCAQTGKQATLVLAGEETEIDKTVIETLYDPLVHMLRNAIDHGIETPAERRAAGKPEEGVIRLSAEHQGGRIVIRMADDGRGLDRARILAQARERGLVMPGASLSDAEIDNLIFLPGFSTAQTVSSISGRGVGMDVVNENVRKIGGRVAVQSQPGAGSAVTVTLPLTLALMDGMVVRIAGVSYLVPLTAILENQALSTADIGEGRAGGQVLRLRGEEIRLIDMGLLFGGAASQDAPDPLAIVVESSGEARTALIVEEIVGQQQVVVKSLEKNFRYLEGLAGATVLGDGEVALIIDVAALEDLERTRAQRGLKEVA